MPETTAREPVVHARTRPFWAALAYLCAGLALLGVFVPGLPTTPFVLLAAWAAARGSRPVHAWLHTHPRLGPVLVAWERERAVSTPTKLLALGMLVLSWAIMAWRGMAPALLVLVGALFVVVGTFVTTRATPRDATRARD